MQNNSYKIQGSCIRTCSDTSDEIRCIQCDNLTAFYCQRCDAMFCEQHVSTHLKYETCALCGKEKCVEMMCDSSMGDIYEGICYRCYEKDQFFIERYNRANKDRTFM